MDQMFLPLKRYADFTGRSRRTEYWLFQLFKLIVYVICWSIFAAVAFAGNRSPFSASASDFGDSGAIAIAFLPLVLAWLVFFVPSLALQMRRFHDQGISGWICLLNIPYYIPYLGWLVALAIIIMTFLPGTNGPNQYGQDPKFGGDGPDDHLQNVFR